MSYTHILIATDLSDITDKLLKKGTQIGWLFEAKISLLHVVNSLPIYGYSSHVVEVESELAVEAEKELNKLGQQFNIPTEDTYIRTGSATNIILEFAKEHGVDLIIVGSHGRSGLSRLLGSCASGIVHGAERDVFVMHNGDIT